MAKPALFAVIGAGAGDGLAAWAGAGLGAGVVAVAVSFALFLALRGEVRALAMLRLAFDRLIPKNLRFGWFGLAGAEWFCAGPTCAGNGEGEGDGEGDGAGA